MTTKDHSTPKSTTPTTIKAWLKSAKSQTAALDAELILVKILGYEDRSALAAHDTEALTAKQQKAAAKMLRRRQKGEPLAYILGYKDFYGRRFSVSRSVLIPRPESEAIIDLAKSLKPKPQKILDVGTGSGCLALTLAAELKPRTITAVDISLRAILRASRNALKFFDDNKINCNLNVERSDLLKNVAKPKSYDLIVANLPYVNKTWDWLDLKTLAYEPQRALFAETNGLALYIEFFEQVKKLHIKCPVIIEADPCQHQAIKNFLKNFNYKVKKITGFAMLLMPA